MAVHELELNVSPADLKGKIAAKIICFVLGIGCILPWNSMLTIEDYYAYLFPNYHPSRLLTLSFQPFALATATISVIYGARINTRRKNLAGYTLFFLSSLVVLVLDLASSGKGGLGIFIGICATSSAFGVATAAAQSGIVGELSYMQPAFVQSFLGGGAASGALTSALRSITKASFGNSREGLREGAILFLGIASLFELFCVLLYAFAFSKLPIVKHYRSEANSGKSKTTSDDGGIQMEPQAAEEDPKALERLSVKELLRHNKDYVLDMVMIYVLTLTIFPGFLSEDTGSHNLGTWYPLVVVAMYNLGDLVGRYVPVVKCLKMESRKGIKMVILARLILIPAFYVGVRYGGEGWIMMLTYFLGLSNGYLTVCVFTLAPQGYKGAEQNAIGNILVLSVMGGTFAGVILDWLWLIGKGW